MGQFGWALQYFCLAAILGTAVWQDVRTRKIKNRVSVTGAALGLASAVLLPERHIADALLGFFVMLGTGMLCWKLRVFRAGDAKLLCAVGSFTGWKMGLNCLLIAVLIGAAAGLPAVITRLCRREKGRTPFPFSIAIAAGWAAGVALGYLWELPGI